MNATIERILSTGEVEDSSGATRPIGKSPVAADTGALLYDLVRETRPGRTIETGMAYGVSTLFICQAQEENRSGEHTAIDPGQHAHYGSIGLENIRRAGLDGRLRFFHEPSDTVLPRLAAAGERFDLAFIDGSHRFHHAIIDLHYIGAMIRAGGLVVVDDLWMREVRKAVSYFLGNGTYDLEKRPAKCTMGRRILRSVRRFAQDPLPRDIALKLVPHNVAILRKT